MSSQDFSPILSNLTSSLLTTARDINVVFPQNTISSSRIILIPVNLVEQYTMYPVAGKFITRIDTPSNVQSGFTEEIINQIGYVIINNINYVPFTCDNSSSFDVYLRCFRVGSQLISRGPISGTLGGYTASSSVSKSEWVYTSSITKSGANTTLLHVSITQSGHWDGHEYLENLSTASGVTIHVTNSMNYTYRFGSYISNSITTSHYYTPPPLSGWAGGYYAGTSAYNYKSFDESDISYILYTSGSGFDQFTGSGNVPVSLSVDKFYMASGSISGSFRHYEDDTTVQIVRIRYEYYLN